jgi:peptidoglycan/xylan/chitin deacetylase (PgdA/CDA1 family)
MKSVNKYFSISPYPEAYKAAVCISFDYETSAQSKKSSLRNRIITGIYEINNKIQIKKINTDTRYGRGFGNRIGADKIIKLFKDHQIHGTWFSTGHVLLKNNYNGKAFRINQKMPYMNEDAGFHEVLWWHSKKKCFHHDPHSDYRKYPFFYLGDQAESLRNNGEDIQYHTFSHPYIPLETNDNLITDLEDWLTTANRYGFVAPSMLAFPFLGDYYIQYPEIRLNAVPTKLIDGFTYQSVGLTDEQIKLFYQRGIEVFTRCGSKNNGSFFKGFRRYNDSDIYYLSHYGIMNLIHSEKAVEDKIYEIIEKEASVDFWIHPNDIYQDEEFSLFSLFIKRLISKFNEEIIWITSLQEMWKYFKSIQQVTIHFDNMDGSDSILVIHNTGNNIIKKLAIDFKNISFEIEDFNIKIQNNKIILKIPIEPDGIYKIRIKNICYKN